MNPLVILIGAATMVASPDGGKRVITLDDAVALARKNALTVVQAEGQVRGRNADVLASTGAFLPSVSVGMTSTHSMPSTGNPSPWGINTGLNASVTLFSGGSHLFDLQAAKAQARGAESDAEAARWSAGLTAQQSYFNVLAARESQEATQAQLDQAQQQLRMSIVKLRARVVTRSDSLRSQIAVHSAELARTQANVALAQAEASLTRAIGATEPVTAATNDTLDLSPLTVSDQTLQQWVLQGPAVRSAQSATETARATLRTAWASWLPSLTASYSRYGAGSSPDLTLGNDGFRYGGQFGLTLSVPIFDQFQRRAGTTRAEAARDASDAGLRDARLGALESLTQWQGAFDAALERVATQSATLDAAQEDLREQQQGYQVGSTTLLDVLASETTLDQARLDLIQARYDLRVARAQLEALAGRSLRA